MASSSPFTTETSETLRRRLQTLRETDFAGLTQLQIHVEATRDGAKRDGAKRDGAKRDGGDWQFKPSLELLREAAAELQARDILFQTLPWLCAEPEVYRALAEAGSRSFAGDYPEVALQVLREEAPALRSG
jgi:hypothetical protein